MRMYHRISACLLTLLLLPPSVIGGQTLQPGFYLHEPASVGIRLINAKSGLVCDDLEGQSAVCNIATRIKVSGQDTCSGMDGKDYPCTRYGYEFDYEGASSGESIHCTWQRRDPYRSKNGEYEIPLDGAHGAVFFPSWIGYAPVQRRTMLTEVHSCTYRGEMLATIEYILNYEPGNLAQSSSPPGGPAAGINEPYLGKIYRSCSYLTDDAAKRFLRTRTVQEGQANEHIPDLWSQCTYSAIDAADREVGFIFKFMLYEMFDVEKLPPMQLTFNVTFAAGGQAPSETLRDVGKMSFGFERGDRTTLMVITGIQGPPDGANRPREFLAFYYLKDPGRSHTQRLDLLRVEAERHLREWHAEN